MHTSKSIRCILKTDGDPIVEDCEDVQMISADNSGFRVGSFDQPLAMQEGCKSHLGEKQYSIAKIDQLPRSTMQTSEVEYWLSEFGINS